MIVASEDILLKNEELYEQRKNEILHAEDSLTITGTTYYISNDGDDSNDGKSPDRAWKSLKRVAKSWLYPKDAVLFRRGDLWRGTVETQAGVTYGAYGIGEKPKVYGGSENLADKTLWEETDEKHHIYKYTKKVLDVGTLVFNDGETHSRKLIPSYKNLQFVCREDENRLFVMADEMTQNLDIFWHYDKTLTTMPSRGENFPVPCTGLLCYGDLYLRCDEGNPGEIFESIEYVSRDFIFNVDQNNDVTIDNICIKYGCFGVSGWGNIKGLRVTNCEIGWIGGNIQNYSGTDPNYPEGMRGTVTRFGNAIEIYGDCENYVVSNNYIYQAYDAGITHQVSATKKRAMKGVRYTNNLVEKCVYGIEYFLNQVDGESESYMDDIVMEENIIRLSGYGWGQQRHNVDAAAHIKGWSYRNTARNFFIRNNIFDRSAYRMLHLVALKDEYCPKMNGNTYIQHMGGLIGQYGGNEVCEPENMVFDENAENSIKTVFGDASAKVYIIHKD